MQSVTAGARPLNFAGTLLQKPAGTLAQTLPLAAPASDAAPAQPMFSGLKPSHIQANYVKFAGTGETAGTDDEVLGKLPANLKTLLERARTRAAQSGAAEVEPEHVLWAVKKTAAELAGGVVSGKIAKDSEQAAFMLDLLDAVVPDLPDTLTVDALKVLVDRLKDEVQDIQTVTPGVTSVPLRADVRDGVETLAAKTPASQTPEALMDYINGSAKGPAEAQISRIKTMPQLTNTLRKQAPLVGQWVYQAINTDPQVINGKNQIGPMARVVRQMLSLAAEAATPALLGNQTTPVNERQKLAFETLNAVLPPEERHNTDYRQVALALQKAVKRLDALEMPTHGALVKASEQTFQSLLEFMAKAQGKPQNGADFVEYLKTHAPAQAGAPAEAKTLSLILSQVVSDAQKPLPIDARAAQSALSNASSLMGNMLVDARGIANEVRADEIGSQHMALAMLRLANKLIKNAPEYLSASPDQVPNVGMKLPDGSIINLREARIVLDALLPVDLRADLSKDQAISLLSKAELDMDKLVYQHGKQVLEGNQGVNIPVSGELAQAITIMLRKGVAGGEGAYAFGRSLRASLQSAQDPAERKAGEILNRVTDKARSKSANIPDITFDQVGGYEKKVAELKRFADQNKGIETLSSYGIKNQEISRGMVLHGPPGNGKTYMAKALANYLGLPFFEYNGAEFGNQYINTGAIAVRDMFNEARKHEKALIFIDEADSLLKSRTEGSHEEDKKKVNTFLSEMDGLMDENPGTIVVVATNNMKALDPAALRPGRLTKHVEIKAPNAHDREQILKVHTKGKPLGKDVDLKQLAELARGRSSVELRDLAYNAALKAHDEDEAKGLLGKKAPEINMRHFEEILEAQRMKGGVDGDRRARTAMEYRKVLEEQKFQPNAVMKDDIYEQLANLIEDFDGASESGGDKAKYERRLDYLLNKINWAYTEQNLDVAKAKKQLEADHTGLEEPKKKILRYLAVQKTRDDKGLPPSGKIMAMVGPPGVGKTSLAMSLGRAMGRQVVTCKLGNVKNKEEITGFSSTYVGSLPGKIAEAIASAKSMNPIVVLDEIDKVSPEMEPVLMDLLSPTSNHAWLDSFLGVPLDLSNVMFVATANDLGKISPPLRDRMDIIDLDGYDGTEKLAIAKNHLVPKQAQEAGLDPKELRFTDPGLQTLIDDYTFEAGVRNLEFRIKDVAENYNTQKLSGEKVPTRIGPKEVREILGPSMIRKPELKPAAVGRVNGLAVMGDIGGALFRFITGKNVQPRGAGFADVDAQVAYPQGFPNQEAGKMSIDSLHDVREWINANIPLLAERYGFEREANKGQMFYLTPQKEQKDGDYDGPSAGAAKTTMMVSAMTNRRVRNDLAMTGTMNAFGDVGAIGGLRHKIRGAIAAGCRVVLFPMDNFEDHEWARIPQRMKDELALVDIEDLKANPDMPIPDGKKVIVCPVQRIEDVLDVSLLDPPAAKTRQTPTTPVPPSQVASSSEARFSGNTDARKRLTVVA